jgi:hypothetical protein
VVLNGCVAESHESGAADDPAALRLEVESVTVGGRRSSTLKGVVVGAAVGTAVTLATKDGQAVVKPGARLVVKP